MTLDDLMYKPGLLAGERILVTGGGTGLGRVMAEAFLMLGAEVYLCGRRGPVVEQTARELMAAHGGKAAGHACDVRQPEAIEAMLDAIWADGGPLTGLVNNAAGNFVSRTEDLSMRAFDAVANIVMRGSFNMTLECGRRWLAAGQRGSVLSILTTWVWNGSAFTVPSAMAKSALLAMTRSLAVEWGPHGIRSVAIAPGPFPTAGAGQALDPTAGRAFADAAPGAGAAAAYPANPLGRVGRPPELAELAAFLVSDSAAYINGEMVAIDGGQHLRTSGAEDLLAWGPDDWARARAGRGG